MQKRTDRATEKIIVDVTVEPYAGIKFDFSMLPL